MSNEPKLYVFCEDTAYGEVVEIVSAYNKEQAWSISKASTLGWTNNPIEIQPTLVPSTIFMSNGATG